MFKSKLFIAALAVAPCAYAGPIGNQNGTTSIFLALSAMTVATMVWSSPPLELLVNMQNSKGR